MAGRLSRFAMSGFLAVVSAVPLAPALAQTGLPPSSSNTQPGQRGPAGLPPPALPPAPSVPAVPRQAPASIGAPLGSLPATPTSPQQAAPGSGGGGSGAFAAYNMSGLMEALIQGRFADIPDDQETRTYPYSILKGMVEVCGDAPGGIAIDATRYGSSMIRQMETNPQAFIMQQLQGMAGVVDPNRGTMGRIEGMANWARQNAQFIDAGVEDGRNFGRQTACGGPVFRQMYASLGRLFSERGRSEPANPDPVKLHMLMSPAYRASLNIRDPAEVMRERAEQAERARQAERRRLATAASRASCTRQYQSEPFCECLVTYLTGAGISTEDIETTRESFDRVTALSLDRRELRVRVRQCAGVN